MNEVVAVPRRLRDALRQSVEENKITFLSAGPGWGKTVDVQNILKAQHPCYVAVKPEMMPRFSSREPLVVLDDYQNLSPRLEEYIIGILRRSPCRQRFVILSRAPLPDYLSGSECTVCQLDGGDLALDVSGISRLAAVCGMNLTAEQLVRIRNLTRGYPVLTELLLDEVAFSESLDQEAENGAYKRLDRYLDRVLYCRLEPDARQLLLRTAFFDCFTSELATILTKKDWNEERLTNLRRSGGPISSGRGRWTLTEPDLLAPYLRRKAEAELPAGEVRDIHLAGGDWYADSDDFATAVQYYQTAGDRKSVIGVLTRNVQKDASAANIVRLKKGYQGLTQEEASSSPALVYAMCLMDMLDLNVDRMKSWHQVLLRLAEEGFQREAMNYLLLLHIIAPPCGSAGLEPVHEDLSGLPLVSLTNGLPSVLRCCRDFSDLLAHNMDQFNCKVWPVMKAILGPHGVGLRELLQAEWRLERGEDITHLFLQWHALQVQIRQCGTMDMEFVCVALMVRSFCVGGQLSEAISFLSRFRQQAETDGGGYLLPGIDAIRCRLSLLEGSPYADSWLDGQNTLEERPFLLDQYQRLTMVRCHIRREEYPAALLLLGGMLERFQYCSRPLDQIEALTLAAICCFRSGSGEWNGYLKQALEFGTMYNYTAVLTGEGAALLPLLEQYRGEKTEPEYWRRLLNQTIFQAECYPRYLKPLRPSMELLTPRETAILHLLFLHKTNEEISHILGIQLNTVKSHLHNLFVKLGVRNREQAREAAVYQLAERPRSAITVQQESYAERK